MDDPILFYLLGGGYILFFFGGVIFFYFYYSLFIVVPLPGMGGSGRNLLISLDLDDLTRCCGDSSDGSRV
jgi:hypothetical protein